MASAAGEFRGDQELIHAIREGEAAAFDVLYRRHREFVLRVAMRFTGGDADLALDVLQETFLYVLRKLRGAGGLELTGQFTTFLYPAVKHIAIRARPRNPGSHQNSGSMQALDASVDPASPRAVEDRSDLEVVLGGLAEEHREVVWLRFVDGLSLEEIAAAVGAPLGTVKSRLHHALRKLREDPRAKNFFEA